MCHKFRENDYQIQIVVRFFLKEIIVRYMLIWCVTLGVTALGVVSSTHFVGSALGGACNDHPPFAALCGTATPCANSNWQVPAPTCAGSQILPGTSTWLCKVLDPPAQCPTKICVAGPQIQCTYKSLCTVVSTVCVDQNGNNVICYRCHGTGPLLANSKAARAVSSTSCSPPCAG